MVKRPRRMLTTSSVSAVVPQRLLGRGTSARGHHALRLIDGASQQARNEQLQRRGDEGRDDGDCHLPGMAQRHAGDAQQRAEALAPGGFRHMGKRFAALRRAAGCILVQGKISNQIRGLARTNEADSVQMRAMLRASDLMVQGPMAVSHCAWNMIAKTGDRSSEKLMAKQQVSACCAPIHRNGTGSRTFDG